MSFWGPVLAGGLGFGASLFGSASSAKGQREANDMNYKIAQEQMAFQREGMMNRHQWEVEDMKKAGLNPMLSANSTPGIGAGATATMINERPNRGELMLSSAKAIADIMLTKEQTETEQAQQDALQGAVADAKNRSAYANSPFGKGMSWVKNTASDVGSAVLAAIGLSGSAKAGSTLVRSLSGANRIRGFSR